MRKLFISGGRGMVGRNLLECESAQYWDIDAPGSDELDLRDYAATLDHLSTLQPDFVIHAAGLVGGIHANMKEPVRFLVENIDIGRNVILAAREAGVKNLINLGSSCIYPRNISGEITEDMIMTGELEPTNEGYALAKMVALRLCEYINREADDFNYKTLIPCNLYGRYDKFDPEKSHLVPAIIRKVHEAKVNQSPTVEIWGSGEARRDFMYAGDTAAGIFKALEDFVELSEVMNLGTGRDYTINEYYETAATVIGWQGEFVHDLDRPVGMARKLTSVERQQAWGWMPPTSLEEGIAKTYEYYIESSAS